MSREIFDDWCRGCRPAILDLKTGLPLSQDSPEMQAVMKVWEDETSLEERQAFHRVTCLNSRDQADLAKCSGLMDAFLATLKKG